MMVHSCSSSNLVFFDLETKRSAAEVGGWSRIHALGFSMAITRDLYYFGRDKGYVFYLDRGERWMVRVDW